MVIGLPERHIRLAHDLPVGGQQPADVVGGDTIWPPGAPVAVELMERGLVRLAGAGGQLAGRAKIAKAKKPAELVLPLRREFPIVRGRYDRAAVDQYLDQVEGAIYTASQRHVNRILVAIARRDQLLVDRLLGHLDRLEQGEEDPDRLGELFQLDHLVTRMRRNDENLRSTAYFDGAGGATAAWTLAAWALAGIALLLVGRGLNAPTRTSSPARR